MSRIGKQPISIPAGVTVTVEGPVVKTKGPKGELSHELPTGVTAHVEENVLHVAVTNPDDRHERALWGLSRSLLANMVTGVADGFSKSLELVGVGYKLAVSGSKVTLNVGFSHPVELEMPKGIEAKAEKNTLTLTGADKQLVGEMAARIRRIRKPEPYKGKGIRYTDEVVRRKAGKAAKAAA